MYLWSTPLVCISCLGICVYTLLDDPCHMVSHRIYTDNYNRLVFDFMRKHSIGNIIIIIIILRECRNVFCLCWSVNFLEFSAPQLLALHVLHMYLCAYTCHDLFKVLLTKEKLCIHVHVHVHHHGWHTWSSILPCKRHLWHPERFSQSICERFSTDRWHHTRVCGSNL